MLDEARVALDVLAGVSRSARRPAISRPTLVVTAKPGIASGMLQQIVDGYVAQAGAAVATRNRAGTRLLVRAGPEARPRRRHRR